MDIRIIPIIAEAARRLFYDDSDEEDDNNYILEKIDNYAENTVPNMTNRQFQMHFRMHPDTFEDLLHKMHIIQIQNGQNMLKAGGHPSIPLDKAAMILIWCLGNIESFRSVADRFGVSKSTCWSVLYRTCRLLLKVNKHFGIILWPSGVRARNIITNFELGNNMPGVIVAIDGSHMRIVAPKNNHNSYINRKSYHSVLLQGVCNNEMLFTDVYAGEAGSIHDMTLYKRSDLYARIRNNEILLPDDSHLLGDLAYSLSDTLLVGYKNYGNLSIRQKNFNLLLSKTRVVIENAFALLKGRFRRLKFIETVRLDLIPLLIVTAAVLHNICIMKIDLLENIINIEEEVREEAANNPYNNFHIEEDDRLRNASIKRNNIVNLLPVIIN